jgi:hypothetical protein
MPRTLRLRAIESTPHVTRARLTDRPVILIGFQNQGNLGLGYLASTLKQNGYSTYVVSGR